MAASANVLLSGSNRAFIDTLAMEMRAEAPEMNIETCSCASSRCTRTVENIDVLIFDCDLLQQDSTVLERCLKACDEIPCIVLVDSGDVANLHLLLERDIQTYLYKSRPSCELAKLLVRRISSLVDIHYAEKMRCRTEKRLQTLVELAQTNGSSFADVANYVLNKIVELTDSEMGYLAFLEGNGRLLRMHAWSEKGWDKCRVPHKSTLYDMNEVGIWGEPIRQRKPIVVNDFSAENPLKRGVPNGHVQMNRYMAVPIYYNGEIVATAGVANKTLPYDESDVVQISLLVDGMVSIQHGIKMRREIMESQGKYQALLDLLPFTVAVLDETSRILSLNKPPPGINLNVSNIVGLRLIDYITDAGKQYSAIFQNTIEKNELTRQEATLKTKDGQIIHLDVCIAPIPPEDTDGRLYIATISDITNIRRAFMNMHKTAHKMQLMESMTYHDIFNQIQIMRGYLELMSSEEGRSERDLSMFSTVEKAAVNVSEQMKLLRDYYALGMTEPDWLDLEKELKRALEGSGLNPDMVSIRCNGVKILADISFYKAIFNLYHNSVAHGETVTAVSIDYERLPDASLKLVYRDNGVGIPADKKEKIFLRGFGNHTGLGMFLVREIFSSCGFSIVENGTNGACFEIRIPANQYRISTD